MVAELFIFILEAIMGKSQDSKKETKKKGKSLKEKRAAKKEKKK
jgi:hypothetical protein